MDSSAAYDINNAGQIALQETSFAGSLFRSYVYLNGNYTEIDSFESSYPTGINNAGHVVGHDSDGLGPTTLSYFYADGEITEFVNSEFSTSPFYFINGLNDADQLVGVGPGGGVLATPVPEPASLLLFAGGLAVVGLLLSRK